MAETHELRLKIDAAAAKRGSREFTAAVEAVKRAVRDLERDSNGAFTQLRKNLDTLSKHGKMKFGVDRQSIRDLNDFAKAQQQIVNSTTSSSKGIKTLVSTMRGLSDSYSMARKTSEAFASSILKTNSALNRQIQLASQARSAVRQVRTAPSATVDTSVSGASAKAAVDLSKEFATLRKSAASASSALAKAFSAIEKGARGSANETKRVNDQITRMANLQLSSAAAIRRAEQEAVRLSARLKQIGDTSGAAAINQALIKLKATLSGGVGSALDLRKAMDQFSQSTNTAKIRITQFNASQTAAAAEAKRLAAAQKANAAAARETERNMRSLAGANNAAKQAMDRATGGMRGLENAFSASFQAGSLFRTMLGSITFGTFTQSVFAAGDALQQFKVSMEVAMGSASAAMSEMDYVDEVASRLGVSLNTARDNYSKFAISANIAGVSAAETRKIFESVSTSMAVLGKSTEDQNLAFLALEQMMSKGKVSSEELRRQLGERLPGAVNMMAQALDVSVDKLQELLKAGAINSADALPKFADVLMERFGPGLEQASRRAGNNLQKLRNEITKFLEEVAQAGVMDELAAQFRKLTDQLASGDGVSAAQRLGEGLANMARVGGEAVSFLVENLDTLGTILKAIGVGIVTRQLGLMTAALATSTQQVAGYTASWAANRTTATAATAAMTSTSAAMTKQAASAKAATVANAGLARSQEIALRAALTHRTSILSLSAAMTTMGRAAGAAAAGAATLSRAMSVIAPIAGIALTAILLIPGAMDAIGLGADNMSTKVNAALARAGVAFDEFGETIRKTASQAEMARLIGDLNTLEEAATRLGNAGQGRGGLLGNILMDEELALGAAISQLDEDMPRVLKMVADYGRIVSGFGSFDESVIGSGASAAIESLFRGYIGLTEEQGDAVELQKQLNAAMLRFPSAAPIFEEFEKLVNQQVRIEQGISNTTDAMTRLYGTENERLALEFAEAAKQVLRTGEGIDELAEKQKVLSEINPEVAATVARMREEFDRAFASSASPLEFQQSVSAYYSGTADQIKGLKDEVQSTERAVGEATDALMTRLAETVTSLQNTDLSSGLFSGFDGIDPEVIASFQTLFERFNEFQSGGGLQVSAEGLQNFVNTLQTASPAAAQFKDELINQFSALTQTEQTYSRLDSIMLNLKARFPEAAGEIDGMTQAILKNAKGSDQGALAYSELASAVLSLPWPTEEAAAAAMEMLGLAANTQSAGNAADAATGSLYAAADGTDAIADGAAGATAQVRALQAALASLGAVAAGVQSAAAQIVDDINFQAQQKAAPIWERAMNDFRREQTKVINEAFDAALAEMPEGDRAGGPLYQAAVADRDAALAELASGANDILEASQNLYNTEAWKDPNSGSGGGRRRSSGGGGGRSAALTDEQKAVEKLNESLKDRLASLQAERIELALVASGQFETAEGARLMAEAMVAGGGAVDQQTAAMIRQIDAAAKLNEELQRVAKDPVKEWMDSVPNWIEAGQQIEMGAINHLKDAISEFIQTGKFDIEALGEAILGTIADIVADKAVAELANLLGRGDPESGGLGGLLGGLFGSQGDEMTGPTMGGGADVAQGGIQAGNSISQAMIQAGQQVSQQISQAMVQGGQQTGQQVQMGHVQGGQQAANASRIAGIQHGQQVRTATMTSGNQHATQVRTAITTAGQQHASMISTAAAGAGGGGGFLGGLFGGGGGLFSMLLGGLFSEGGYSTNAVSHAAVPASAFRNAPHFSQGTTNTSGIPAVLHPNEAVIPLSKGRKIPVDLGGAEGGQGGGKTVVQTFNISTPDADSFRKSQKQIAADGASAAQRAMSDNR
ncbi:tail tape-measure protein [Bacteriophage DSS3_MAL1]|nr:tail tape-measure protein [Bacteriophage DSS3_MAL1]